MSEISKLVQAVRTEFLPKYNIGVRRFAELSGLSRTRLTRLLDGVEMPTVTDVTKISDAMRHIQDRQHARVPKRTGGPDDRTAATGWDEPLTPIRLPQDIPSPTELVEKLPTMIEELMGQSIPVATVEERHTAIPSGRVRTTEVDRMGFAWEENELPGMTLDEAVKLVEDHDTRRAQGQMGNEYDTTIDYARKLIVQHACHVVNTEANTAP